MSEKIGYQRIIEQDIAEISAVKNPLEAIKTETTKDIESVAVVTTFTKLGGEIIGASTQYFIDTPDGIIELVKA